MIDQCGSVLKLAYDDVMLLLEKELGKREFIFSVSRAIQRAIKKDEPVEIIVYRIIAEILPGLSITKEAISLIRSHNDAYHIAIDHNPPLSIYIIFHDDKIDLELTRYVNRWFFAAGYLLHQCKKLYHNTKAIQNIITLHNTIVDNVACYHALCDKYMVSGVLPKITLCDALKPILLNEAVHEQTGNGR